MPKRWLGSQSGSWEAADPGHKHQGQPNTQTPKGEAKLRQWFSNQDNVAPPGGGGIWQCLGTCLSWGARAGNCWRLSSENQRCCSDIIQSVHRTTHPSPTQQGMTWPPDVISAEVRKPGLGVSIGGPSDLSHEPPNQPSEYCLCMCRGWECTGLCPGSRLLLLSIWLSHDHSGPGFGLCSRLLNRKME